MKNFKKKAIFTALMGALSTVSSFAMEDQSLLQVRMHRSKSEKNYKFLKNLKLLKKDDPDLEQIFTQMAIIYQDNFGGLNLNPGFVTNKLRKQKNLKKSQIENIEEAWSRENNKPNPRLDAEDQQLKKKAQEQWKYLYQGSFKADENTQVLIHSDSLGNVHGFLYFELDKEEENIHIRFLATKPSDTGTGVAGRMLKKVLTSYEYEWARTFTLDADNEIAESFFGHFGFKKYNPNKHPSLNKQMILQRAKK